MRIAFYSTMFGQPWGGSEELWSRAAGVLLARGHATPVSYRRQRQTVKPLEELRARGAEITFRRRPWGGRSWRRVATTLRLEGAPAAAWLARSRPDFVLASVGFHRDDLAFTRTCRRLGVPYGILVQAASPYHAIEARHYESLRAAYAGAARTYFVSDQNRAVLEAQLALDLADGEIVDNAFNVRPDAAPAWSAPGRRWRLACVGRLQFEPKGQDLLLDVLRRPKWRARPLEVALWGADGGNRRQIEAIIKLRRMESQVRLAGFADDVEALWRDHHGLVMASRFEGNALAMIEAMLCGRVPIVTSAGRAAELVDDNRTGFVAAAATTELIDDALERAWQRRDEWQALGARASEAIRQRHSLQPAEDFAERLLDAASHARRRAAA